MRIKILTKILRIFIFLRHVILITFQMNSSNQPQKRMIEKEKDQMKLKIILGNMVIKKMGKKKVKVELRQKRKMME